MRIGNEKTKAPEREAQGLRGVGCFLSPVYSRYQTTDRGRFGHSIAKLARFFTDFHKTLLKGERLRLDGESGNIRIGDKGFIPPPQVHFLRPCRSPELR